MYSVFDHWAYWSHMLTVISMFSPCTQWVFGPLSPVSPTPSTSTQLPDPQPTPSPSGFLSSVSGPSKPKPISKSLAKALGLDDDSWQKFLLTAELLRQSAGSSDNGKFSVVNPDKFDGTKPEKLETFKAQCRSVYLTLGDRKSVV